METRKHPGLPTPGTIRNTDNNNSTEFPRPVVEIRDELRLMAVEAYDAGRVVDPERLDELANELLWCATLASQFGGNVDATMKYAKAVAETAELARLIRQAVTV